MVLNARRVQSSRHCVTCLTTKSEEELKLERRHRLHILLCAGQKPRRHGDDHNMCRKIPKASYPRVLLHDSTRTLVIMLYIMYVAVSVWGVSVMDIGFDLEGVVRPNPMQTEFHNKEMDLFNDSGPTIMFVVDEPVRYEDWNVQKSVERLLAKATNSPLVASERHVSWLQEYLGFLRNISRENVRDQQFYKLLRQNFLSKYPQYRSDIVFSSDGNSIESSRFYVFSRNTRSARDESLLLINMREILRNTSIPLSVYSPDFVFYEHHVSILKTTILTVTVTIISMLLVALVFIPHPIAVVCVIVSMTSVVLGFLGFLKFWKLSLSAIKTIQLLIAVGLCLNFTVHLSHSFMIATGKSRKERVSMALEKVGGIIMNEAISLFLGILMLAFGSSYLFTSFFKCMVDVIALGLLHSMVLLPVLLTFIGPRRTSKPKVFVPVSPSCRSIDFTGIQYASTGGPNKPSRRESAETDSKKDVQETSLTRQLPSPISTYGATTHQDYIVRTALQGFTEDAGAVGGASPEHQPTSPGFRSRLSLTSIPEKAVEPDSPRATTSFAAASPEASVSSAKLTVSASSADA